LHKLVVLSRRASPEKRAKDREAATRILGALIDKGQVKVLREVFAAMPRRWQNKISRQLTDISEAKILEVLKL
jgi:hypothetical protein